MEALWELEDKWKLSTQKAIAIFACTSFLLVGACVAAGAWRRRRRESVQQSSEVEGRCTEAGRVLLGWVRWSKWEERWRGGSQRALLVKRDQLGWQSHNSTSAVWQRPILMGDKCQLPRFSGLILYDHTGTPLHQPPIIYNQEMMATAGTTLRELL